MVLTEEDLTRLNEILDKDKIITQISDPTLYNTETQCVSVISSAIKMALIRKSELLIVYV